MSQRIKKKFIGNDQVDGDKLLLEDGQAIRAMDGDTEVDLAKITSSEVHLNGFKVLESDGLIPSERLPSLNASVISSISAGNLVATDVQAALNELDAEKVKKSGDTMSGLLDITLVGQAALEVNDIVIGEPWGAGSSVVTVKDGSTDDMYIQSADQLDAFAGNVSKEMVVGSGYTKGANSGQVSIVSGVAAVSGTSGAVFARSASGVGATGFVTLKSGDSSANSTGTAVLRSGDAAVNSGNTQVRSGSSVGDSGVTSLLSGASSNANSGQIQVQSGAAAVASGNILISSGSAATRGLVQIDGSKLNMLTSIDMNSRKITELLDPTDPQDASTKKYSDDKLVEAKEYTDAQIALIPDVDLTPYYTKTEVDSKESGLDSKISTEKSRIDAILSASDAEKDSFAEIVQLINSVDAESDSAFAGYVLSNNSALAQEVSDRQSADSSEASARIAGDSAEASARAAADSAEEAARIAADSAEQTRAMGIESNLQSQISQEVSDRQSADSSLQSSLNSEISDRQDADSAEQAARIAADSDLQAQHDDLDGYAQDVRSDLDDLDGYAQDVRSDLDQEIVDRAAAVSSEASARIAGDSAEASARAAADSAEEAARIAADSAEQSRAMGVESGLQSQIDSEASAIRSEFAAADANLQSQITSIISNTDPAALDSLSEIVSAFESADSSLNGAITSLASSASSALSVEQSARIAGDSAEASARASAISSVQSSADALEDRVEILENDSDIVEVESLGEAPAIGLVGKLYTSKDSNKLYRWATSSGGSLSFDKVVGEGEEFATLQDALAAANDGENILVKAGTYLVSSTIAVNKQVKIVGEDKATVIFETAATTSAPVSMFNVSVNNAALAKMTIKHKKTSNTSVETAVVASGGGFPQTRIQNFIMEDCIIEYAEFGLTVRAESWCVRNTTFTYATGSVSNSCRAIGIYGNKGNSFIKDVFLKNDVLNGTASRPFYLTSTTGSNPNETTSGKLVIEGTTHVGPLAQFFNQDNQQSEGAGTFELQIKNNVINESNLFAAFYSAAANAGDMFSSVTLSGNSISNLHAIDGGKGLYGVAGTAAFRSSPLIVHASNNILGQEVYRAGWGAVEGATIGKETAVPAFSVALDESIPESGEAPQVSPSGSSSYVEVSGTDLSVIDNTLAEAKAYTDAQIADAEAALEGRLDALEAQVDGPSFSNEKLIVVAEQLGFVELAVTAKKIMSCAVGRLAVHEGEDFDVTVVNGKSRIVWKGSLLSPSGAESIEAGMNVFVVYAY